VGYIFFLKMGPEPKVPRIKENIQARRSGNHRVPTSKISLAVLLCLWYMKYLILQIMDLNYIE